MTLEEITLADFTPRVGESFRVQLDLPQPLHLELRSATASKHPPSPGRRQSFSLVFRAGLQWTCQQGIYPLTHPALGELGVFLTPIGRDAQGTELEAVFNFG
ncbi:DUF6916 family protein [Opitutus terrae]|uniref:DUF6916 domain-containing protein n=1 Tax=Opitutus terrae (strain DSM 11246 / JCM 15787 / PB90-1) TaxID=452637 RepID=B1ZP41_OPITP|nr:hypothetical protein [Opitutus terrae]ACB77527.1 conserved hypothetical protein [Opitutus terrae PB90-1]